MTLSLYHLGLCCPNHPLVAQLGLSCGKLRAKKMPVSLRIRLWESVERLCQYFFHYTFDLENKMITSVFHLNVNK